MGGFIAILYGSRDPGHGGGLILLSTFARFDHVARRRVPARGRRRGRWARPRSYGDEASPTTSGRGCSPPSARTSSDEELAVGSERRGQPPRRPDRRTGYPRRTAEDHQPHAGVRRLTNPLMTTGADEILRPAAGRGSAGGHRRCRPFPWLDAAGPRLRGDRGLRGGTRLDRLTAADATGHSGTL